MPFFSIIIPTYNRAHLIKETIASVRKQTFQDWECIVIDDGSTDSTKLVVQEIIENDERIRYIYQENAERSAARNNGIDNANGEYLCFLDSDDAYTVDNLMNWFQFWNQEEEKEAFAYCNAEYKKKGENSNISGKNLPEKDITLFFLEYPIVPARICIHNNLLKEHKFELDCIICEDICLWMKLSCHFKCFHSNHIGAIYNIHDDNSIHLKNPAHIKLLNGLNYFFNKYPYIKQKISQKKLSYFYSRVEINIAKYYLYNKNRVKALEYAVRSLIRSPFDEKLKYKITSIFNILLNRKQI